MQIGQARAAEACARYGTRAIQPDRRFRSPPAGTWFGSRPCDLVGPTLEIGATVVREASSGIRDAKLTRLPKRTRECSKEEIEAFLLDLFNHYKERRPHFSGDEEEWSVIESPVTPME